jgi:hypothetical protein
MIHVAPPPRTKSLLEADRAADRAAERSEEEALRDVWFEMLRRGLA